MSEQAELVVMDHHHDEANGVYRLTLGHPVQTEKPMFDEAGNPVVEHLPLHAPDGSVAKDVDGKEVYLPGPQKFELVTEYVPSLDFVFADDDDRWKGKSPEEIAAEQRADVKAQMDERAAEQRKIEENLAKRVQLPGAGESL
jgi:hypothetical protein